MIVAQRRHALPFRIASVAAGILALAVTPWGTGWSIVGPATAIVLVALASSHRLHLLVVTTPILMGHAPLGLGWIVGFFAYAPLFVVLSRPHVRWWNAFGLGLWTGATQAWFFGGWAIQGVPHALVVAAIISIYLGLLWAVAALAIHLLLRGGAWYRYPLMVAIIPLTEFLRVENADLSLAYCCTPHMIAENLPAVQLIEWTGFYGLGTALCASSLAFARLWVRGAPRSNLLLLIAVLAAWHTWGAARIWTLPPAERAALDVAVVQHYEPRRVTEHEFGTSSDPTRQWQRFADNLNTALDLGASDLLCLPESLLLSEDTPGITAWSRWIELSADRALTTPAFTPADVVRLARARATHPKWVLAGIERRVPGDADSFANSVMLLDLDASPIDQVREVRDKLIAAPIGEANPFVNIPWLSFWFQGDRPTAAHFEAADVRASIDVPDLATLALCICLEHLVPTIWTRRELDLGANVDLLVVVSNVRWFQYAATERMQGRAARRLMAIQHRCPLLYVSDGGSEWFSASGALRAALRPTDACARWRVEIRGTSVPRPARWLQSRAFAIWLFGGVVLLVADRMWPRRRKQGNREIVPGA